MVEYLYENYGNKLSLKFGGESVDVEIEENFRKSLSNLIVKKEDNNVEKLWDCVSELNKMDCPKPELNSTCIDIGSVIKNETNLQFHIPLQTISKFNLF